MNEQQYIEKVEEMRKAGLCNTSPNSARRYVAQLRTGSDLSLAVAAGGEGICKPGQCILDIETPEQLERLNLWQGLEKLSERERAAIRLFLKIHGVAPVNQKKAQQMEAAREEAMEAEQILVSEASTLKKREAAEERRKKEPPLTLYDLLAALRQSTKNRKGSTEMNTYTRLMRALLLNKDFCTDSNSNERHLRSWGTSYYENAQVILANLHNEQWREEVKKAMKEAFDQIEGEGAGPEMRLDVARACVSLEEEMEQWEFCQEVPQQEWSCYEGSETQLVLQQLASMHRGTISHIYKGISEGDLIERIVHLFSLAIYAAEGRFPPAPEPEERMERLGPGERALLAVVTCGLPMKRKHWKMEEIQLLLLNLLHVAVLIPEQGAGRYDKLIPAKGICEMSLSRELNSQTLNEKDRNRIWKLLKEMMKDAEMKKIDSGKELPLLRQLEELLQSSRRDEQKHLLKFLVKYYWSKIDEDDDRTAIFALDKLLLWMEQYPKEMRDALHPLLPGTYPGRKAQLAVRDGACMIQAELYANCASRCLSLAMEMLSCYSYWATCAIDQAEKALTHLRRLEAPHLAVQASQVMAMGCAFLGDRERCAVACEEARKWYDRSDPNSFLNEDVRRIMEQTEAICEKQLSLLAGEHAVDQRFYGWFGRERSGGIEQVKEIVKGGLGCDEISESIELLCQQLWEKIPYESRIVGWEHLAERMMDMELLFREHPNASTEHICNHLINREIFEYGTLGLKNQKRLRALVMGVGGDSL